MPLPSRRKGEEKTAFVSRCIKHLADKGEGATPEQRAAICYQQAKGSFTDKELDTIAEMIQSVPKPHKGKKKKKDKYRINKEGGGYSEDTVAPGMATDMISHDCTGDNCDMCKMEDDMEEEDMQGD